MIEVSTPSAVNECRPSLVRGLWTLTYRELKKWLKDPIMLVMFILQPLIWMGLLGKSMNIQGLFSSSHLSGINIPDIRIPGGLVNPPIDGVITIPGVMLSQQLQRILSEVGGAVMQNTFGVTDYFSYLAVGMISMIVTTTTMFSGMSIVWDRRLGFLDKIISTPVSRAAIIFAKILNGTLRAMFQATVVLALAYLLGLRLSPTFALLNLLGMYAAIFLMGVGLSSIFIAFSIRATRLERPMQFVNLITMPLMFASNTFFPIKLMPEWMQAVASVNPLTYLTDIIRNLTILNVETATLIWDFAYLGLFAVVFATIGIILSWRYLAR